MDHQTLGFDIFLHHIIILFFKLLISLILLSNLVITSDISPISRKLTLDDINLSISLAGPLKGINKVVNLSGWINACFHPFPSLSPAVLKLTAVASGVVVILGTEARRYLAMNDDGRLYSSVSDLVVSRHTHTILQMCHVEFLISDQTTMVIAHAPADGDR